MIKAAPTTASSLARKLRSEIRHDLAIGRIKAGDRVMAERKLADRRGVCYMTARRALNLLVGEGVLERRRGLGVFVAALSEKPDRRELRSIRGLFYMTAFTAIYARLATAINREAARHGVTVAWSMADELARPKLLPRIAEWRDDAFLLVGMLPHEIVNTLNKLSRPMLAVDGEYDALDVDHVLLDNEGVGHLAARCLLNAGKHRIAYAGALIDTRNPLRQALARPEWPNSVRRGMGVRRALIEHGLPCQEALFRMMVDGEPGRLAIGAWLDEAVRPEAVICFSHSIAQEFVRQAAQRNLRMPDDLAVVALSEPAASALQTSPTVAHYRADWDAMGRDAARLLVERFKNPETPYRRTVVGWEYVSGNSAADAGYSQPKDNSEGSHDRNEGDPCIHD
jgi:DNA-binding LacI/PurR family transcriptional regulator